MPTLTRFMVQGYEWNSVGDLVADEPVRCDGPGEAIEKAKQLAERKAGIVAYSWAGDPRTGETGKIILLSRCGALPKYAAIALGIEDHAA